VRISEAKLVEAPGDAHLTDRLFREARQFLHGEWHLYAGASGATR
jgi:hypothetical protein